MEIKTGHYGADKSIRNERGVMKKGYALQGEYMLKNMVKLLSEIAKCLVPTFNCLMYELNIQFSLQTPEF